jgi:ABC-type nitrate/sulfonate/bicarbonate transport system substrate-binding protein
MLFVKFFGKTSLYRTLLILAILSVVVIAGCGKNTGSTPTASDSSSTPTTAPLEKVKIGVTSSTFGLPIHVAKVKGFFAKYGIDPQLSTFAFGVDTLNALVTQQVEFGMALDYAALSRVGKGGFKLVGVTASPLSNDQQLFVKDTIKTPADLKGKQLGVQRGAVNEYIWFRYLEKYNISKNDVKLVSLTSNAELLAAFSRGDLDAMWMNKTNEAKVLKVKGSKIIADASAINFRSIGLVGADDSIVKDKPQLVTNYLKAVNEANLFIKDHPDEAADIAFQEMKVPKDQMLKDLKSYEFDVRFLQEDFDQLSGIKDWGINAGVFKDPFDLKQAIFIDSVKSAFPQKVTFKP